VGYDSGWGERIALYLTDYMKAECGKKYKKDMFSELRRHEKVGDTTIKKLINITNSENGLKDILERGRLDFDVRTLRRLPHISCRNQGKISCTGSEQALTNL
jgi:DNA primase small subunit